MNYKMMLASALLTVVCSSAVFAAEQSEDICSQSQLAEQARVLCEKIVQLQTEVTETQKIQARDGNNQTSVNRYVEEAVSYAAFAIACFAESRGLYDRRMY